MLDLLGTVLTGGATGIFGTLIGKAFSFADHWMEEKKNAAEHTRTIEMHRLQAELKAEESERELAIAEALSASQLRQASDSHDMSAGKSSRWVNDTLRLVRPVLTGGLIVLVGVIYFSSDDLLQQETIVHSVIYMASSAVLWWYGDRAVRPKK